MLISVIIPLYNNENFIEKALESVVNQQGILEIIVIDDGSEDTSVEKVINLQKRHQIIKLLYHFDKKNHGRSKTRNLGIERSKGKYIAFLDADDYYLPNRFQNDIEILEKNNDIDGVYNAISAHFYRMSSEIEQEKLKLTTIRVAVKPENLFEKMGPIGHYGYFSGIGLTVRNNVFNLTGMFDEELLVAEDTDLWIRMALKVNLKSGLIDIPVAMRGVHDNNTVFKNNSLYQINNLIMYEGLLKWSFKNKISLKRISLIWKKVWQCRVILKKNFKLNLKFWLVSIYKYPQLLMLLKTYTEFPVFKKIKHYFVR